MNRAETTQKQNELMRVALEELLRYSDQRASLGDEGSGWSAKGIRLVLSAVDKWESEVVPDEQS